MVSPSGSHNGEIASRETVELSFSTVKQTVELSFSTVKPDAAAT
ncbi:hypothetical protein LTSEMON_0448 [Salmonella enterica subsp. enterica serovar Montevideo str. S5-403]|uniref:Uncharacterized protein n=1 Tax=Salmonella enterica subsp. enterica serovar Montevideo str. S5-403 TaxID=913242 RepID=G5PYG5_SALMO|nr:hypothetical protein LTSEMON_0448 [Salmonella enterica subsp. enterica serovar Montevideo str. S5-403]